MSSGPRSQSPTRVFHYPSKILPAFRQLVCGAGRLDLVWLVQAGRVLARLPTQLAVGVRNLVEGLQDKSQARSRTDFQKCDPRSLLTSPPAVDGFKLLRSVVCCLGRRQLTHGGMTRPPAVPVPAANFTDPLLSQGRLPAPLAQLRALTSSVDPHIQESGLERHASSPPSRTLWFVQSRAARYRT